MNRNLLALIDDTTAAPAVPSDNGGGIPGPGGTGAKDAPVDRVVQAVSTPVAPQDQYGPILVVPPPPPPPVIPYVAPPPPPAPPPRTLAPVQPVQAPAPAPVPIPAPPIVAAEPVPLTPVGIPQTIVPPGPPAPAQPTAPVVKPLAGPTVQPPTVQPPTVQAPTGSTGLNIDRMPAQAATEQLSETPSAAERAAQGSPSAGPVAQGSAMPTHLIGYGLAFIALLLGIAYVASSRHH